MQSNRMWARHARIQESTEGVLKPSFATSILESLYLFALFVYFEGKIIANLAPRGR